jgi:DNA repair photolyase
MASLWEPYASRVEDRFHVLEEARAAKLKTSIMFGPLLPLISDNDENIYRLLERAAALHVDTIWVDAFNPRPKIWEATSALLDAEFPGLRERYRQILFVTPIRNAYLAGLRGRIARAAARLHIAERVSTCV